MTPLPTIDAAQAKTPRGGDRTDITKSDDVPVLDAEISFAAVLAEDGDANTGAVPETTAQSNDALAKDVAAPELSTPELAVGGDAKIPAEQNKTTSSFDAPRAARRLDNDQILSNESMTRPNPKDLNGASKVEDSVKPQTASMAQRMVEVQMPVKSAASASPAVAVSLSSEGEKVASILSDLSQVKAGELALVKDGKASELLTPKPETQVITKAVNSNVPTSFAFVGKSENAMVERNDPKTALREIKTADQVPSKAATVAVKAPTAAAQTPLVAFQANELQKFSVGLAGGDPEFTQTPLLGDRPSVSSTGSGVMASPTHGAETARHVAQQLVANVTQHPGKVTEISLNPEELGRVRLAMTSLDAAITLSVSAERPETIDLLRRHIDILAQEFRDLGYDNINFSFGDNGPADQEEQTTEPAVHGDASEVIEPTIQPAMRPVSGLDLRL